MADPASKYTDDQIDEVERQIKAVYSSAYTDILHKQKEFNAKHQKKVDKYLKKVANGEMTQAQYDSWLKGQVFQGEQWEAKRKQILDVIYNSNRTATDILNGKTHGVFAYNATYANYEMEHNTGINFGFGIYDTATVSNLIKNNPKLLPEWKIDQPKDYIWNQRKLNKQISLGIVEGESLDKIANRLCDSLCTQNFNKMRTFARTAMTEAQNSGRLFSYEGAKELGIKVKKQWMATLDNHTRISHQQLDGQVQDTDKPFEIDGLKIRYPGDPFAPAALVFNCRCTLVSEIEDYPSTYDRYDNIDGKPIKQMTYSEWLDAKTKSEDISPVPLTFSHTGQTIASIKHIVVQGRDITATWTRRPDKFDFEIEDVINAQGFDGKPKVVSREEFDKAVKAANGGNGFIAQRTYSAPDQETLDAYRDQLYNGKWYVDCSAGGAQYGQGMYCAADYSGNLTDGIKEEMEHYKVLGGERNPGTADKAREEYIKRQIENAESDLERIALKEKIYGNTTDEEYDLYRTRTREQDRAWSKKANRIEDEARNIHGYDYTETITLDPSAKIINHADIFDMRQKEISDNLNKLVDAAMKGDMEEMSRIKEYNKTYGDMDIGAYAASKGYDVINAEGHGASDSYSVILNRTKLIILEDN